MSGGTLTVQHIQQPVPPGNLNPSTSAGTSLPPPPSLISPSSILGLGPARDLCPEKDCTHSHHCTSGVLFTHQPGASYECRTLKPQRAGVLIWGKTIMKKLHKEGLTLKAGWLGWGFS